MKAVGKDLKFVLIGGGSYGWTPRLITDIACIPALHGMHIVLQDIDPEPLRVTLPVCRKVSAALRANLKLEATTNLKAALRGADFVGMTISTGGEKANWLDQAIPERYGVLQTVADTVGPGGWSRALRNIPVMVDIVRTIEAVAPNAWFMNYSNPMTVLTRTAQKVSRVKTIGLCHELQGLLLHLAYYFGVGINHLIYVLEMSVRGRDGLALLRDYIRSPAKFKPLGPPLVPRELEEGGGVNPNHRLKFDMLLRTGYLPAAGDAHTAEFFRHYLCDIQTVRHWGLDTHHRAHTFAHVSSYRQRKRYAADLLKGKIAIPSQHSHEHASKIIAALAGVGDDLLTPINTGNVGQIDNLPREAVVETMAVVNGTGVTPLTVGRVPPLIESHLMRHIPNQEMIVTGSLSGDRELVTHALSCDPRIPSPDIARKIAADVFKEFRDWLPQFHGKWRP